MVTKALGMHGYGKTGVPRLVPKQQNKQTIPGYDKGFVWDHFN